MRNQQQLVLDYIAAHPNKTIREIRNATNVMKPCMRISEINYAWREKHGYPHSEGKQLIITAGRNKYREALKAVAIIN